MKFSKDDPGALPQVQPQAIDLQALRIGAPGNASLV